MSLFYKLTVRETTVGEDYEYAEFAQPTPLTEMWQFADRQIARLQEGRPDLVFEAILFKTQEDAQIFRPEPEQEIQ